MRRNVLDIFFLFRIVYNISVEILTKNIFVKFRILGFFPLFCMQIVKLCCPLLSVQVMYILKKISGQEKVIRHQKPKQVLSEDLPFGVICIILEYLPCEKKSEPYRNKIPGYSLTSCVRCSSDTQCYINCRSNTLYKAYVPIVLFHIKIFHIKITFLRE